jgi:hypothetical protein
VRTGASSLPVEAFCTLSNEDPIPECVVEEHLYRLWVEATVDVEMIDQEVS